MDLGVRRVGFHSLSGGVTITLQDVAVLLGLLIDDHVVTRRGDRDWMIECERLLGR